MALRDAQWIYLGAGCIHTPEGIVANFESGHSKAKPFRADRRWLASHQAMVRAKRVMPLDDYPEFQRREARRRQLNEEMESNHPHKRRAEADDSGSSADLIDLRKAFENDDYVALGRALKSHVESVPRPGDARRSLARKILEGADA